MNVLAETIRAWQEGQYAALATVIGVNGSAPRSAGARMLVFADGTTIGTIGGGVFEHQVIRETLDAMVHGRPQRFTTHLTRDLGMCCGGAMEVFIEPLVPQQHVVVFGGGHVAYATVPLLRTLDYRVTVVDSRDEYATADRFPECNLIVGDPVEIAASLPEGTGQHWLIVTHDHQLDQRLVELLLPRPCDWIGMIGSRSKVAKFFVRLRAAGIDPESFSRLSAPVGLDLDAQTPAEIAIAIAAELIRVRRRCSRPPIPLSEIPLPSRGGDGTATPPAMSHNDSP